MCKKAVLFSIQRECRAFYTLGNIKVLNIQQVQLLFKVTDWNKNLHMTLYEIRNIRYYEYNSRNNIVGLFKNCEMSRITIGNFF